MLLPILIIIRNNNKWIVPKNHPKRQRTRGVSSGFELEQEKVDPDWISPSPTHPSLIFFPTILLPLSCLVFLKYPKMNVSLVKHSTKSSVPLTRRVEFKLPSTSYYCTYLFHWLWPVGWSREIILVRFCWLSVLLIHNSPLCEPDI